MNDLVKYSVYNSIAVLTINNPPVNALGHMVRIGLVEAIKRAELDDSVQAVLIHAHGKTFPAGADIKEFGKPAQAPLLPEVCDRIEACNKSVVAALHGTVLGGGFEVALASHYRIAHVSTKIGLPEVTLGLLPGAGGTQRLPHLCGVSFALKLMLSGKPVGSKLAMEHGLVDDVVKTDVFEAAFVIARGLIGEEGNIPRTMERRGGLHDPIANQTAINQARAKITGSPLMAPKKIIDCVEAAILLPAEAGKVFERTAFEECLASDQSAALRHVFFAERMAGKVPELKTGRAREVDRIGVIGGGTMGAGIAVALLDGGLDVVMLERDAESLESGLGRVVSVIERSFAKQRINEEGMNARLARLSGTTNYADLGNVDLVIEAVVEDMQTKKKVFAQLSGVLKPDAILATNTSYLDIDALAATIPHPENVIGLHFFSPANIMKLLEIIVAKETSHDVVATGFALAKRLGKIGVRAGVADGFIGNRILKAYRLAAEYIVEDGASPYQVDRAMRDYGFKLGPFQVYDLAGLDIAWAQRKRHAATRDPNMRYVEFGDKMCEAGWIGQKVGRGYYTYSGKDRRGIEDQAVLDLIASERRSKGIKPHKFGDAEIQRRCLAAMVNEGAKLLDEKIALRPSDIDVVMIHGYGFPRWRGGPMKAADLAGLLQTQNDLKTFAKQDEQFWQPSNMFDPLIRNGQGFGSMNV